MCTHFSTAVPRTNYFAVISSWTRCLDNLCGSTLYLLSSSVVRKYSCDSFVLCTALPLLSASFHFLGILHVCINIASLVIMIVMTLTLMQQILNASFLPSHFSHHPASILPPWLPQGITHLWFSSSSSQQCWATSAQLKGIAALLKFRLIPVPPVTTLGWTSAAVETLTSCTGSLI